MTGVEALLGHLQHCIQSFSPTWYGTSAVKATLLKKTPLRLRFYLEHQIVLNLPHLLALMESRGKTWEQALKSWYIIFFQVPSLSPPHN